MFAMGYVAYLLADAIALSGIIRFVCLYSIHFSVYSTYIYVLTSIICIRSVYVELIPSQMFGHLIVKLKY